MKQSVAWSRKDTSAAAKPHRGMTMVASRFNGWFKGIQGNACRRYATTALDCRVPKGTLVPAAYNAPAVKTAGYLCQTPNGVTL